MQWEVVLVVVVLLGMVSTVTAPIIKLNTTITKLTDAVKYLQKDIDDLTTKNSSSHDRLWKKNEEQDRQLQDHENRIVKIESDR